MGSDKPRRFIAWSLKDNVLGDSLGRREEREDPSGPGPFPSYCLPSSQWEEVVP